MVKKVSDYLSTSVPLPCLVVGSQQFCPSLFLPYQHKCHPSEKDKKKMAQHYYENSFELIDPLKGPRWAHQPTLSIAILEGLLILMGCHKAAETEHKSSLPVI